MAEQEEVDYLKHIMSTIEDLQRSMQPLATLQVNPENQKMRNEAKANLRNASAKISQVMAMLKN